MFTRFDTIHERRGQQTDGQTPHDSIGRAYADIAQKQHFTIKTFRYLPITNANTHLYSRATSQ